MERTRERTFVMIKPDGVERGLVGEILKRFEQRGLRISALKMVSGAEDVIANHYADDEEWLKSVGEKTRSSFEKKGIEMNESDIEIGKRIRSWLMDYIKSGPVVAMVIEGNHAIEVVRKIVGPTEPRTAPAGTIRGDFSIDSYELGDNLKRPVKNLIHASGNAKEAENEIRIWFSEEEIFQYSRSDERSSLHKTW
jgi:nucleoside-diphosphate kinase